MVVSPSRLAKLATITVECLPFEDAPEGYFSSGDDAVDAADCAEIRAQLEHNEWAWCAVEVSASYAGVAGADYLTACSYVSREDFVTNSGYYGDMRNNALDILARRLSRVSQAVANVTL